MLVIWCYNYGMIKQTVILLIVVFMLAVLANVVYANTYLPIAANGGVHSAAIGYGEAVTVKPGRWLDVACENGLLPSVQSNGNSAIVMCGE